jgi:hypothetical protein
MGDVGDVFIFEGWDQEPHEGETCIKIIYKAKETNNAGWAGLYWQQPANNWGDHEAGGFDLSGARKLEFWARGDVGGEIIAEFKVGGIGGEYPDSDVKSIGPIALSKKWKKYTINLKRMDLSNVIGGFCLVVSKQFNPEGFVIYLDDIVYKY